MRSRNPTAVWHYARCIAYARAKKINEARRELAAVRRIAADPSLKEIRIWGLNPTSALASIAAAVLKAEIAAARKDIKTAVAQLRKAIAIEDGLIYGEPPDWFYPVRHNLGAVLLDAGRARAAEKVYRQDLAKFPGNGWSLFDLAESLRAQGKKKEAAEVQRRFEAAWEHADVEITASRF
jgi:predicted Zn-dependent protease